MSASLKPLSFRAAICYRQEVSCTTLGDLKVGVTMVGWASLCPHSLALLSFRIKGGFDKKGGKEEVEISTFPCKVTYSI